MEFLHFTGILLHFLMCILFGKCGGAWGTDSYIEKVFLKASKPFPRLGGTVHPVDWQEQPTHPWWRMECWVAPMGITKLRGVFVIRLGSKKIWIDHPSMDVWLTDIHQMVKGWCVKVRIFQVCITFSMNRYSANPSAQVYWRMYCVSKFTNITTHVTHHTCICMVPVHYPLFLV